jgi:hypothetical protein
VVGLREPRNLNRLSLIHRQSRQALEADGQTRVVLRQTHRACLARGDPMQLRQLQLLVEWVLTPMQHCGHPPREVGAPPDAPESGVGVGVGEPVVVLAHQVDQGSATGIGTAGRP